MAITKPGGGGSTLTTDQVTGLNWHPTNTDWKVYWTDCIGYTSPTGNNTGGGSMGMVTVSAAGGFILGSPNSHSDRIGVMQMYSTSTSGSSGGLQTRATGETYRFGDGRIKFGAAFKLVDLPDATNEDFVVTIGVSDSGGVFATEACYWFIDTGINTTNWLIWGNGSSNSYTDSGIAFNTTSWNNFEIDIAEDLSSVKYYANGTLYHTETNSSYIPSATTGVCCSVIQRTSVTTKTNYSEIDWSYMAIKPGATRGSITTWVGE